MKKSRNFWTLGGFAAPLNYWSMALCCISRCLTPERDLARNLGMFGISFLDGVPRSKLGGRIGTGAVPWHVISAWERHRCLSPGPHRCSCICSRKNCGLVAGLTVAGIEHGVVGGRAYPRLPVHRSIREFVRICRVMRWSALRQ